jgi:trehalose 6-phosphate phosphatase
MPPILAVHYRLAPRYGAELLRQAELLARERPWLRVIGGRKVVEFQPQGADKGRAVADFLAEPPFAGRIPVYAGDDTTDEDGFRAVNERGGLSIKVLNAETPRHEASAARFRLTSVPALHRWLGDVADRLDPRGGTASFARVLSVKALS